MSWSFCRDVTSLLRGESLRDSTLPVDVGTELAFFQTDAAAHRTLIDADDKFSPKKVGAALQTLNAYGVENGVTTSVLATQMVQEDATHSPQEAEAAQAKYARVLGSLSRTRLEAYCARQERHTVWFLPAPKT